jgi:lysozyme
VQQSTKILFATALFLLLFKRTNPMKTTPAGIDFIAGHEGFLPYAYDDFNPAKYIMPGDPIQGTLTIGYGHTATVKPGQRITEAQGKKLLAQDIQAAEDWVKRNIKVDLRPWQFDALVSHAFNTGGSSNLAKLVNGAPTVNFGGKNYNLGQWWTQTYITSKGKPFAGLQRRRNEEYKLYTENFYT